MSAVARAAQGVWHRKVVDPFADEWWGGDVSYGGMADVVQAPVYRPETVTARHIDEALEQMFDPENVHANEETHRLCLDKARHYLDPNTNLDDVDPHEMRGFLDLCDITDPLVDKAQEWVANYLTQRVM
jgi:hypothetical protein